MRRKLYAILLLITLLSFIFSTLPVLGQQEQEQRGVNDKPVVEVVEDEGEGQTEPGAAGEIVISPGPGVEEIREDEVVESPLVQTIEQSEIQTITINRGEEDQLEIQVQKRNQEEVQLQVEEGAGETLFQMDQLRIREEDREHLRIEDGDAVAFTNLSITVDPETNLITITTPSGKEVVLKERPSEVLSRILEEKLLDSVDEMNIEEDVEEAGQVRYRANGVDERKFLGLFTVRPTVEIVFDAETGEEISRTQPWYLNWFGFLFGN